MKSILKNSIYFCVGYLLLSSSALIAQVPVSEEPMHRMVLQNQYIRLLDVWVEPGDTTLFHIHETPSLFVYFSNTVIRTQVMGQDWITEQTIAGKTWYRSFFPDILVHRVCNEDTMPLHVIDVEILAPYDDENIKPNIILPFPLLFQNDKAFAYKLTRVDINNKSILATGPFIIEMVSGDPITYRDIIMNTSKQIEAGHFLYIEPGTYFSLEASGSQEALMVLFEIK